MKVRALYRWKCVACGAEGAENADSPKQIENIRHGREKGNSGDTCGGQRRVIARGKTFHRGGRSV